MGLVLPGLASCDAIGGLGIPGADCPALKDGNVAALSLQGSAEIQGQLKGFISAVYSFDQTAATLEADLLASCKELGTALGMEEAELDAEKGEGDEEGAKKVCGAVTAKLEGIISASADFQLEITAGEPVCELPIDAVTECLGNCGAVIEPGNLEASCEGGSIRGECSAECTGTCIVEGSASCGGTCNGTCEGTCNGEDVSGTCDGTCEGSCSGSCSAEASGTCEGTCEGGCSAEFESPSCTGTFKPPSVSVECQTQCAAQASASLKCSPPTIGIELKGEGEASADLKGLVDGLRVALPKIINIQKGLATRLVAQGKGLVEQGQALPSAAKETGLQGIACIAMAAETAVSASASVSVNVEASASLSGAVGTN